MTQKLPVVVPIKLGKNLAEAFKNISGRPYSFFLDSATDSSIDSRYSFAGTDPVHTISTSGGFVTIDGHTTIDRSRDAIRKFINIANKVCFDPYLPFAGGLVGFIGFEWGNLRGDTEGSNKMPDTFFGLYDTVLTYDKVEGTAFISSFGLLKDGQTDYDTAIKRIERLTRLLSSVVEEKRYSLPPLGFYDNSMVSHSLTKDRFINSFDTLKNFGSSILFAPEFASPTFKTPWDIYTSIRKTNPTPYSSFLNCGDFHILSSSRTCLMKIANGKIETKPTKGSVPRGTTEEKDRALRDTLKYDNSKHEAHDHMLTDTMNAMEKLCEPGTVDLEKEKGIETDAKAHHLVSKIVGLKRQETDPLDCLLKLMPASLGEAKIARMLGYFEGADRNAYTGTIGFIGGEGRAEFSLAFRTLVLKETIGYLHSGTEVHYSSDPEEAYSKVTKSAEGIFEITR